MDASQAYEIARTGALSKAISKINSDIEVGKTRTILHFPQASNTANLKADLEELGYIITYQDFTGEEVPDNDKRKVFIIDIPDPNNLNINVNANIS